MLKNDFYTVVGATSEGNTHKVLVKINALHPIFDGHFPQQPVVPGVCTMQLVKECASDILGKRIRYSSISSCKFISAIVPSDELVEVNLVMASVNVFQAVVSLGGSVMLKMKANIVDL
jgi:3-hydroxyacyl-[acyl-carrier-protein] dehydratase